jgi:hypothetical protein
VTLGESFNLILENLEFSSVKLDSNFSLTSLDSRKRYSRVPEPWRVDAAVNSL